MEWLGIIIGFIAVIFMLVDLYTTGSFFTGYTSKIEKWLINKSKPAD